VNSPPSELLAKQKRYTKQNIVKLINHFARLRYRTRRARGRRAAQKRVIKSSQQTHSRGDFTTGKTHKIQNLRRRTAAL